MSYPQIKIRNKVYQPKKGDYILDNGTCFMFCAGDGRTLDKNGFSFYDYISLTKKAISEIDLVSLEKEVSHWLGVRLTKYYYR
jgi:hypothetical protein